MLAVGLLLQAGCAGPERPREPSCRPAVGMTIDQLAACGCLLLDNGALASAPMARTASDAAATSVIIVNYICPLGQEGVARVSVRNGVAEQLF